MIKKLSRCLGRTVLPIFMAILQEGQTRVSLKQWPLVAQFSHNNPFNTDVLGNNDLSFSSDSELSEKINSAEKGDFDLYTIGEKNSSRAAKRHLGQVLR